MEARKGFLTPDQEKTLEGFLKFNNKVAEAVDGIAIQLIDNQVLERLKSKLESLHPEAVEVAYQIIDELFNGLEKINKE